jgi:hypothetical protein
MAANPQKILWIGNVFDYFHVEDNIEASPLVGEAFRQNALVFDIESALPGVLVGDGNVFFAGIYAGDAGAKPPHGFAKQAAATTDVEKGQILQWLVGQGIMSEMAGGMVSDIGDAERIDYVQKGEGTFSLPPAFGQRREARDFIRGGCGEGLSRLCFSSAVVDHRMVAGLLKSQGCLVNPYQSMYMSSPGCNRLRQKISIINCTVLVGSRY